MQYHSCPVVIFTLPHTCLDNRNRPIGNPPPPTSSGLDLDHVNLLLPNQTTASSNADPLAQTPGPSVPPNLVQKIEAGAFIEMGDLVPNHLNFEDSTGSKSKHHQISNIAKCFPAFAIYCMYPSFQGDSLNVCLT